MLDEIGELHLYIGDPEDESGCVSREHLLVYDDRFRCIPRAMTTIARWCLYGEGRDWDDALKHVDDTIEMLRHWCGFAEEGSALPAFPQMDACENWMGRYLEAYCARYAKSKKPPSKEALADNWARRRANYEREIFSFSGIVNAKADAFSYQKAIARALREGPLKRRCLLGKLEPREACTSSTLKKDGSSYRNPDKRNIEYVLLLTALCLRGLPEEGGVPKSDFIALNKSEALSWKNAKKDDIDMTQWLYDGEQVFVQRREAAGIKPWRVSQRWLDDGQWQLLDITEDASALDEFSHTHASEGFRCYVDAFESAEPTLASFDCDEHLAKGSFDSLRSLRMT